MCCACNPLCEDDSSFKRSLINKNAQFYLPYNNLFLKEIFYLWITAYVEITYGSGHASGDISGGCEAGNVRRRVWSKMCAFPLFYFHLTDSLGDVRECLMQIKTK